MSDINKDKNDIYSKLSNLERENTYQHSFRFKVMKIANFYIRVNDCNLSINKKVGHRWRKKDLNALPKVTDLKSVSCAIYVEHDGDIKRITHDDARFEIYSNLFDKIGLIKDISVDTLCSLIYYCVRLRNLTLLI